MEKDIEQNIIKLRKEFKRIKNKGYIKGVYNNISSIGRTFETELGLDENYFSIADYYGIEIKTRRAYSTSAITLFTSVPDGEDLFEIERLKNTYGYPCKLDRKFKVLYGEVYGNKVNGIGVNYKYKLDVDRNERKVYLCVLDRYLNLIEKKVYWSFDYLEERIMNKLRYLAIINTWTNDIDKWPYFKYYKMDIYKLISFNKFLDLIDSGVIYIKLLMGVHLDEKRYGQTYDHGSGFVIEFKNIPKLFNLLEE